MSHQIIIQPSGHVLTVESGETILEAALRAGLSLPYGCRNGSCGLCKGEIIQGTVDYGQHNEETLTETEKREGRALLCCASPLTDLVIHLDEISATKGIEIKTLPCRVEKLELVAPDVMIVSLKLPANQRLQFLPGQYIDILLKEGQRRSFSLANAPHDDEVLQLHVRNYPGGAFTEHVFTHMKVKDMLRFTGPLGSFFLRDTPAENTPIIFLASGTGFAPIKSILEHIFYCASNPFYRKPMTLYWGVRIKDDLYLTNLINEWQQQHPNFNFIPVLSEPLPRDHWQGRTGFVHHAVMQDHTDLQAYQVYACGSPIVIKAAYHDFTSQRHLPNNAFFSDIFTPSTITPNPG